MTSDLDALLALRWPGVAFTRPGPAPLDDTRSPGGYSDPACEFPAPPATLRATLAPAPPPD